MATEIYQIKEAAETVLMVNETVEKVVFIATERNGRDGQDGTGSVTYSATLGSVTSVTISSATHAVPVVRNVTVYHPDGYIVSVVYSIVSNNVIISSNINLLNHSVKIY